MQHPFRTREVEIYVIWVFHGCCDKSGKNVIIVLKKSKKTFSQSGKGVLDVKWREESKKAGPDAVRRLLFEELAVF